RSTPSKSRSPARASAGWCGRSRDSARRASQGLRRCLLLVLLKEFLDRLVVACLVSRDAAIVLFEAALFRGAVVAGGDAKLTAELGDLASVFATQPGVRHRFETLGVDQLLADLARTRFLGHQAFLQLWC